MKINYNGKEVEAYDLKMKKENALSILSGTKKAEIRTFSDYYIARFVDSSKLGEDIPFFEKLNKVGFARFRNYNTTWFVDVKLNEISLCTLDEVTVKELNEDFGFHELDEEWQQYKDLADGEKPLFFLLGIDQVVASQGI